MELNEWSGEYDLWWPAFKVGFDRSLMHGYMVESGGSGTVFGILTSYGRVKHSVHLALIIQFLHFVILYGSSSNTLVDAFSALYWTRDTGLKQSRLSADPQNASRPMPTPHFAQI